VHYWRSFDQLDQFARSTNVPAFGAAWATARRRLGEAVDEPAVPTNY